MLSYFTKFVGGIASYLHKKVVRELGEKIRNFIDKVVFDEN